LVDELADQIAALLRYQVPIGRCERNGVGNEIKVVARYLPARHAKSA
jgi:hypothetical protein